VYDLDRSLRYAGSVQPHLKTRPSAAFVKQALTLRQPTSPFGRPPRRERGRDYVWLRPELVCEVAFLEWTKSGEMRHPMFRALHEDKAAGEVTGEPVVDIDGTHPSQVGKPATVRPTARGVTSVSGIKISNGDRVVDPTGGHTKLEVVRYYEAIAEWALP
jgi:bifunctional non-homologous end joining protein LigD